MKRLSIGKLLRIGGIGGFEIRRKRGVRFIGTLAYCLIGTLFFSCAKDSAQPEQSDSATTGRTVRKELTLQIAPMQGTQGKDATRAATDVPLNEDEKKIHSLWVLQFAGTADASTLVKKDAVTVSEINATTGAFYFDFMEPADGGQITVYLLANMEAAALTGVTTGTTLGAFKASNLSVSPLTAETMKTGGLPMIASQSFDYTTSNPAAFALKSLLAKVVFRYSTIGFTFTGVNLYAKNLASAVPVTEPAAGASVQHPSGINYTGSLTLVGDATYAPDTETVCYLPENLSGQVAAITQDKDRGGSNVPAGAAYMNIRKTILNESYYSFYPGDGTASDFNLRRHYEYAFDAKLRGTNTDDKRVTAGGTANCYLVDASNTAYSFLATVMGNGATTPADGANTADITPTALSPVSAVVLWEQSNPGGTNTVGEVVSGVSYSNGYIHFTTGTSAGNVVIAALDGGGNIIWSWHIWRPDTNPGDVACHTTANGGRDFTMMGLNLGALNNKKGDVKAYGLLYQWGRKDPFPGATDTNTSGSAAFGGALAENGYDFATTDASTSTITVADAVVAPMSFYYKGPNNDWISVLQDNLWGNPYSQNTPRPNPDSGSKSIYDPCPVGYRVPPQDTWAQATSSNWTTNGQNLSVGAGSATYFYPACGWRDYRDVKLVNVGLEGYYWSSSPYSYNDKSEGGLYFTNRNVSPVSNSSRAYGINVRCMKEQ